MTHPLKRHYTNGRTACLDRFGRGAGGSGGGKGGRRPDGGGGDKALQLRGKETHGAGQPGVLFCTVFIGVGIGTGLDFAGWFVGMAMACAIVGGYLIPAVRAAVGPIGLTPSGQGEDHTSDRDLGSSVISLRGGVTGSNRSESGFLPYMCNEVLL